MALQIGPLDADEGTVRAAATTSVDDRPWASSVIISAAFIAVLSVHFLNAWPKWTWLGPSAVGPDMWGATNVSNALVRGSFTHIYNVGLYDSLPLWPIVLTPVMAIADGLGLRSSPGTTIPTLASLVVPVSLGIGVLLAHSGRTLAWELGTRKRLWLVQVCLLFSVLLPCAAWGHMEDALAVSLLLYAIRFLRVGRLDAAAIALGLSIASKEWAILAAPMLIVAAGVGWRRFTVLAFGPSVVLALSALALDPYHAYEQLLASSAYSHNHGLRLGPTEIFGPRGSRLTRPIELAAAPLVAIYARRRGPAALSATLVAALLMRPLAEPILFPYYLVPAVAVLTILMAGSCERPRVYKLALPVALTLWASRMDLPALHWWPVALGLLSLLCIWSLPALRTFLPTTESMGQTTRMQSRSESVLIAPAALPEPAG